jgi:hypothetical protein
VISGPLPTRRYGHRLRRPAHPLVDAGPGRCGARTAPTAAERATLAALPRTVDPVAGTLACELAAGHDGPHTAFTVAADDGECWWWMCWSPRHRQIVQIDPCAGTSADPAAPDCCLLPDGHPGPHSFAIA